MAVSESQKKATEKYLEKFDTIRTRVPKGDSEKYKDFAKQHGVSLNALVVSLLEKAVSGEVPVPGSDSQS